MNKICHQTKKASNIFHVYPKRDKKMKISQITFKLSFDMHDSW